MADEGNQGARPPSFGRELGIHYERAEGGTSLLSLEIAPRHLNPNRVLHGAVSYSLADDGMGAALFSLLGDDEACATIEIKMNYLKPVTEGRLVCETRVVRKGRSIAVLESTVSVHGEPIAIGLGTYAIMPRVHEGGSTRHGMHRG